MKTKWSFGKLKSFQDEMKDERLVGNASLPDSYQGELFLTI